MWLRVIVAVVYGVGAVAAVLASAVSDGTIDGKEWGAILSAFAVAAWGKFSSNTTILGADREVWSAEERAQRSSANL